MEEEQDGMAEVPEAEPAEVAETLFRLFRRLAMFNGPNSPPPLAVDIR